MVNWNDDMERGSLDWTPERNRLRRRRVRKLVTQYTKLFARWYDVDWRMGNCIEIVGQLWLGAGYRVELECPH